MNIKSVQYAHEQMQQEETCTVIWFRNNEVFCPMCEIWHENNTNCQRND